MFSGDSVTRYQYLNFVYFLEYSEHPQDRDRESICWYVRAQWPCCPLLFGNRQMLDIVYVSEPIRTESS